MTDFELGEVDRLLTTTKQVRKRLDLSKEVPLDLLLDCIEVAGHAPVGCLLYTSPSPRDRG